MGFHENIYGGKEVIVGRPNDGQPDTIRKNKQKNQKHILMKYADKLLYLYSNHKYSEHLHENILEDKEARTRNHRTENEKKDR